MTGDGLGTEEQLRDEEGDFVFCKVSQHLFLGAQHSPLYLSLNAMHWKSLFRKQPRATSLNVPELVNGHLAKRCKVLY